LLVKKGGCGKREEDDDELSGIETKIVEKLSAHIHSIVSSNPPVMYVAHKYKKKIIKALVKFPTYSTSPLWNLLLGHLDQPFWKTLASDSFS
jgi:hypothetical protein